MLLIQLNGRTTAELYLKTQAKLNYLLCGFMAPLSKPSHIEWISSSLRDKKEQILERQKKFTGSEKMGGQLWELTSL